MVEAVLPGPCMPQPTAPTVTRLEGATVPSAPRAAAGMMTGMAKTADCLMKWRRLVFIGGRGVREVGRIAAGAGAERKICGRFGAG